MRERTDAGRAAARGAAWTVPGPDVAAGAAEIVRLLHTCLPSFTFGRCVAGSWVAGPAPAPRRLPQDLSDSEHAAFLVRLAGLLSFLGAHGLGLSEEGARGLGCRPGTRDVPWLHAAPVPAWRTIPSPQVLGLVALRLSGRDVRLGRGGEARRGLEEALAGSLPPRTAEAVATVLRSEERLRPSEALLLDLARETGRPARVALDLLGLALPREMDCGAGERLVAAGAAAEWVARGAARRGAGEVAFAEAGPPDSLVDGAPLLELAEGLGEDPRAEALRALARGGKAEAAEGPPLVLLARDVDRWSPGCLEVWEEIPRVLPGAVRVETSAEAPPPWRSASLLVPRLGREEVSGLVHLPYASPVAFTRLWADLADEAGGDAPRLLQAARRKARTFLDGLSTPAGPRTAATEGDVVLRAAALLADGFAVAEAAAAAGTSAERVAEVLDEAVDEGVLAKAGRGLFRFPGDGPRRRLAADLRPDERLAALARLEASGVDGERLLLAQLAVRGDPADVAEARRRLGEAAASGRTDLAIALLSRAPEGAPDLDEPLAALEAYAAGGRMSEAREASGRLDPARTQGEPLPRREKVALLLARLGAETEALALLPDGAGTEERLARAGLLLRLRREEEAERLLDLLEAAGAGGPRRRLLRAELLERRQRLEDAARELGAAIAELEGASDEPALADARLTAAYLALGLGRPREARRLFRAAADEAREPARRADALFDLSVAAAGDGEPAEAERALEEALALFATHGESDRYLSALSQCAVLALGRSDARAARRDLATVLAHDRRPGRAHQLLFSVPLRQRLSLADGDDADGAEAFAEAAAALGRHADHPARREILVLEGARLLAAGRAREALAKLEEAAPHPDARSCVEPFRARLVASALRDLGRPDRVPGAVDVFGRTLLEAEERLAKGLAPAPAARHALAERLERPDGPIEVLSLLLEWKGRFPGFFATDESAPLRELGTGAARRAGLEGAAARLAAPPVAAQGVRPAARASRPAGPGLVAEDASTREVLETVRRVAPTRLSILVLGESGTGKEVVAREVHRASLRGGAFVAVNVAALPETLAEAELFGTARGAFTGADRDRPGVFESSSGGTLFLDEIGDLSPAIQAKLLRVLQEREVRRLGETKTRAVDLRLVAATHRDLPRLAAEGRFREDLLYRIAQLTVTLPPLRERPRDLRALLERAVGSAPLAPDARAALLSWGWPGNVRELLSAVESAKALAGEGERIERRHLPPALRAASAAPVDGGCRYREAVDAAKRRVILQTLAEAAGNRTRAAALLGLSRQSLLYELKRLAITD